LESLGALRCPPGVEYDILVVDNNSTDRTAAVLEEFAARFGSRLRSVFEPRQGLSHARNRAIAEARGEVLCFIDDDAIADRDWLAGHVRAYREDEQIVAVGGRILLHWPAGWSRPVWLAPPLDSYLSAFDLGPRRQWIRYPHCPFGCNMSVRREVARAVGGFSVHLGRKGRNLISGEEQHFFYKLSNGGGRMLYEPQTLVYHLVPVTRLSKQFMLRRAYAQGLSNVLLEREIAAAEQPGESLVREFLGDLKNLTLLSLSAAKTHVCAKDSAARFLGLTRTAFAAGRVVGMASSLLRTSRTRDSGISCKDAS
jgi:glycosyltransferase involved in cell wall biosynthesis